MRRQQLVALGGLLGVVPVALADQRAAVHQFARLVRAAFAAVLAQHQDLGIGDGLADGIGPAVHL
jgi:hypothetical protein